MNTALFWNWFQQNNSRYLNIDSIKDEDQFEVLLDEFLAQLHQYCSHLYFQIGGNAQGPRELIISAEGDLKYFEEVERLVADAPELPNWVVIAFKPPRAGDFKTRYEDVTIASDETWFMPLQNVSIVGLVLRLYFTNYDAAKEQQYLGAAYQMLDSLLGEKLCAEMIRYVEVAPLVDDPSSEDLYPLHELQEFIEWYISQ